MEERILMDTFSLRMDNLEVHSRTISDTDMDQKGLMTCYFRVYFNMVIENKEYLNIMTEISIKGTFKIIFTMEKEF